MSFFRVTSGASPVPIPDLGVTIPALSAVILSNQFSTTALQNSADLESLIITSTLAVAIDYGIGFAGVAAGDYTNRDCLAAFLNVYEVTNENNNEDLVDASEVNASGPAGAPLHIHDARYYRKAEIAATGTPSGAQLVGVRQTAFSVIAGAEVQAALDSIDDKLGLESGGGVVTLDKAYSNDSDGILNVNGSNDLEFRSNNTRNIKVSRSIGVDLQFAARTIVGSNELQLGSLAVGALAALDVRVMRDLIVDGNIFVTGQVTDTTVNELNVTNANIHLRDAATAIPGADASLIVERGTSGTDAALKWDHASTRWKAGIQGSEQTLGLLEANEVATGIWELQGPGATSPSEYLTNKAAAPSVNLGSASQIPLSVINNKLAIYDKTNSRNRWLSVYRCHMVFWGRDSANNSNEYARAGDFTSNNTGIRIANNKTLVGISAQTTDSETWTVRVRKNNSASDLASLALTAVFGAHDNTYNVDFSAGDNIQVYIDSTGINRPLIRLEFAERF